MDIDDDELLARTLKTRRPEPRSPMLSALAELPDAILICRGVAGNLTVSFANPACHALLGLARDARLDGEPLAVLLGSWLTDTTQESLRRAILLRRSFTLPLERVLEDGTLRRAQLNLRITAQDSGALWVGTMKPVAPAPALAIERATLISSGSGQDLTESAQRRVAPAYSEEAETAARHQAQALYAALPAILLSVDTEGTILDANEACLAAFGVAREAIVGRALDELLRLPPDESGQSRDLWPLLQDGARSLPCVLLRPNGQTRDAQLAVRAARDAQGTAIGATLCLFDVAEHARGWRRFQQHELRRLGHDLHDGVGQELTGAALLLKSLEQEAAEPSAVARLTAAREAIERAMSMTRELARGVSLVHLTREEFPLALERLARTIEFVSGIPVELAIRPDAPIEDTGALVDLYRIAQEALNNASKHSRARAIRIELAVDAEWVALEISDDGVGVDGGDRDTEGLGLRIMRDRARMLGAVFDIIARDGGGTVVQCLLRQ